MNDNALSRRGFFEALANAASIAPENLPDNMPVIDPNGVRQPRIAALIDEDGYTPTAHFYRQQLRHVPQITPVFWTLRLYGLVDKPLALTHEDLLAMSTTALPCTLACVGSSDRNTRVGHALWSGVPMVSLLERVGMKANARYTQFYAADGYTTFVETDQLDGALLAYQMNGETLPREHGYPARLIVPGLYGYKMPKWIQRIEMTDTPKPGFWEERGWSASGAMQTGSAILSPHHMESVSQMVLLSGVAYSGECTITTVEISVDDGPWMPLPVTSSDPVSWSPWQIEWTAPAPGDYLIKVRSSDSSGFTQAENPPGFPGSIPSIVVRITA